MIVEGLYLVLYLGTLGPVFLFLFYFYIWYMRYILGFMGLD